MANALAARLKDLQSRYNDHYGRLLDRLAKVLWDRVAGAPDKEWYFEQGEAILVLDVTTEADKIIDQCRPHPHPGTEELKTAGGLLAERLLHGHLSGPQWSAEIDVDTAEFECYLRVSYKLTH